MVRHYPFRLRRPCGRNEARRRPRGSCVVVLLNPTARRHDLQVIGSDAARVGGRGRRNRAVSSTRCRGSKPMTGRSTYGEYVTSWSRQ